MCYHWLWILPCYNVMQPSDPNEQLNTHVAMHKISETSQCYYCYQNQNFAQSKQGHVWKLSGFQLLGTPPQSSVKHASSVELDPRSWASSVYKMRSTSSANSWISKSWSSAKLQTFCHRQVKTVRYLARLGYCATISRSNQPVTLAAGRGYSVATPESPPSLPPAATSNPGSSSSLGRSCFVLPPAASLSRGLTLTSSSSSYVHDPLRPPPASSVWCRCSGLRSSACHPHHQLKLPLYCNKFVNK